MTKIKLNDGDTFLLTAKDIEEERIEMERGVWCFLASDVRELYKLLCKIVFAPKNPKTKRHFDIR